MKKIDFSHPGGFPFTQDQLNYLQDAYTECINALTNLGVSGSTPVIINGMELSVPGSGLIAITDGWFFYNGELVKFTGDTLPVGTGGTVAVVEITPSTSNLIYNDGSSFPAILEKTATFIAATSVTDATHFPYSAMKPFQLVFGHNGRESSWNSLVVNTDPSVGGVTGTIYYKKNFLTNTLQIRGSLIANYAQNLAASPYALFYTMCMLPADYTPAQNVWFGGHYFLASMIKDDMNVGWIKQLTIGINTSGVISVNWIKPEISISGYGILFNAIVPLD